MSQPHTTRFDFAKPSTQITRAIVIRGKSRFAIVRPDHAPRATISKNKDGSCDGSSQQRLGGLSTDERASDEFEAGMMFGEPR